ncbi:phosphopantetheine-binding protein [Actinosynnema sp. CS-041913]|uniref:phosphopantetheine-binding protein n=1 Tax=Actinosynnema sp. CS-041913 TaxID=3239917 RepID=UPI003D91F9CC
MSGWDEVHQWVLDQQDEIGRRDELPPDLDLYEAGVLTSLQVIELLVVIERARGEKVDRMAIEPDDFRTLDALRRKFFGDQVPAR